MALEKSQIKFAKSEQSGELIGFVSRHSKTKKLKGVREGSTYGKQICVLSEDLKDTILPNILYEVELKAMHNSKGYVVVSAIPIQFKAKIEKTIIRNAVYQVTITFGNKTIYFDPKDGKSPSSRTLDGVIDLLNTRNDIENLPQVIEELRKEATDVIKTMRRDGYYIKSSISK